MKLFKKSTLSLALTAAMVGGFVASQSANALPITVPAAPGDAYVNPNGLGQVLIFPYYTVRGGNQSFFNITNTSNDTLALKVRFHEGQNSRDALDFNLVLSPFDVWTGFIEDGANGPVVKTNDNSCAVGAPNLKGSGQALSKVAYGSDVEEFQDLGPDTIDRTREGYVEVITMGKAIVSDNGATPSVPVTPTDTGGGVLEYDTVGDQMYFAALHDASGVPGDCTWVNDQFVANAPTILPVAFPFADTGASPVAGNLTNAATGVTIMGDGNPNAAAMFTALLPGENPLKGNFSVIAAGNGIGAGNAAIAIADFMALEDGQSLITAQNFPYFLEPSIASREDIWSTSGLADVEAAITSATVINEWANNPATGAAVDWAVTFPTKGFHVDNRAVDRSGLIATAGAFGSAADNIQAGNNQWRTGVNAKTTADAGAVELAEPFNQNIDSSGAEVEIVITGYDREEADVEAAIGNTNPSPFPPNARTVLALEGETNLITFGASGVANSALFGETFVLNFPVGEELANGAVNGWARMSFVAGANDGDGTFSDTSTPPVVTVDTQAAALPVIGYAFKSRNQGDAALSFGQAINHAYENLPAAVVGP